MSYPLVILGGGLSGLAAGIRFARFGQKVLILEKHFLPGGLNSYYFRNGRLFETGLHAMTNYVPPGDKQAPLNRLFRQLKLKRKEFVTREQIGSEIIFPHHSLKFSNDFSLLQNQISKKFPKQIDGFNRMVEEIANFNPFLASPRTSARKRIKKFLNNELLVDMLLCPLMFYGNNEELDMDYSQFVIMFRSVLLEGFFRPEGTIKDLLDMLLDHYQNLGGEISYNSEVCGFGIEDSKVKTVKFASGDEISCDRVISTIGAPATMRLLPGTLAGDEKDYVGQMSFVESIYLLPKEMKNNLKDDRTIIFYNMEDQFCYSRPDQAVNTGSGVICFPANFADMPEDDTLQVRVTHTANYDFWAEADNKTKTGRQRSDSYLNMKELWSQKSLVQTGKIIGNFAENIVYEDSFTPLTIEKFTNKTGGAIYGSPIKIKDGRTNFDNLFLAGTDQGFLGIVGAMLSGITIVNQCVLLE